MVPDTFLYSGFRKRRIRKNDEEPDASYYYLLPKFMVPDTLGFSQSIKEFLCEPYTAVIKGTVFEKYWDANECSWN